MKNQVSMNSLVSLLVMIISAGCYNQQHHTEPSAISFADSWEFAGVAVEEPGYHIWGSAPIMSKVEPIDLFVARWPCEFGVDPGWRSHCESAYDVGDEPEGLFTSSDVFFQSTGVDSTIWKSGYPKIRTTALDASKWEARLSLSDFSHPYQWRIMHSKPCL